TTAMECGQALHRLIKALDAEPHLLEPEQLARRLTLLDQLDALTGEMNPETFTTNLEALLLSRARVLRARLEAAHESLYRSARSEILAGHSHTLRRWLLCRAVDEEAGDVRPGLGFDWRDEMVSGVLQLREPDETGLSRSPEMVPYQPTPARHILDLIAASKLSNDDLFVDLGSGLGHVPLLVSILTGSRTLGVEVQAAYVASAKEAARDLDLRGVQFAAEDARAADLSNGTVFYLFSPFTGSILAEVLSRLRRESKDRQIKICSLGPCTCVLEDQSWLKSSTDSGPGRIAVFQSR
ncbi:MAG TPA: hypothetical protein VGG95_07305, partial [Edaphobacter sp.]